MGFNGTLMYLHPQHVHQFADDPVGRLLTEQGRAVLIRWSAFAHVRIKTHAYMHTGFKRLWNSITKLCVKQHNKLCVAHQWIVLPFLFISPSIHMYKHTNTCVDFDHVDR